MSKKTKYFSLILFPIALLLNFIASKVPNIVEKYYSQFIDKIIVQILSKVSGIFPFSLYEITMYIIVISIFLFLCCTLSTIFNKKKKIKHIFKKFHFKYIIHCINSLLSFYSALGNKL